MYAVSIRQIFIIKALEVARATDRLNIFFGVLKIQIDL